jgi:hypothetical protein
LHGKRIPFSVSMPLKVKENERLEPSEITCPYGCKTGTPLKLGKDKQIMLLAAKGPIWVRIRRKKCTGCDLPIFFKEWEKGVFNHNDLILISFEILHRW